MGRDHYRALGVSSDATTEEIERAFRALARRLHPDVNGGDGAAEERMKEINLARDTLTDVDRRAAFDEERGREQLAKARAKAPQPRPAEPPAAPLVSWMAKRDAPAPVPRPEVSRSAGASRLFWYGFVGVTGLVVVVGLVFLSRLVGHWR